VKPKLNSKCPNAKGESHFQESSHSIQLSKFFDSGLKYRNSQDHVVLN